MVVDSYLARAAESCGHPQGGFSYAPLTAGESAADSHRHPPMSPARAFRRRPPPVRRVKHTSVSFIPGWLFGFPQRPAVSPARNGLWGIGTAQGRVGRV